MSSVIIILAQGHMAAALCCIVLHCCWSSKGKTRNRIISRHCSKNIVPFCRTRANKRESPLCTQLLPFTTKQLNCNCTIPTQHAERQTHSYAHTCTSKITSKYFEQSINAFAYFTKHMLWPF